MNSKADENKHLTLTQATELIPGTPSSNCVWRWCREGVKSRGGKRVYLKHIRLGGRLFTTRRWINEFGTELAEADAEHFGRSIESEVRSHAHRRSLQSTADINRAVHESAEEELESEGL